MAYRHCPSKACVCAVLTVWLCASVAALIATSLLVLRPFLKTLRYRLTTCRTESSFYTTQYVCHVASCNAQPSSAACTSTYPCLVVHVSLNHSDGRTWIVNLYADGRQQEIVIEVADHQCSLSECSTDRQHNRAVIDRFHQQYGQPGLQLDCLYDPWHVTAGAVLALSDPGWLTLHCALWPSMSVLLALGACGLFCRRCHAVDGRARMLSRTLLLQSAGSLGNRLSGGDQTTSSFALFQQAAGERDAAMMPVATVAT